MFFHVLTHSLARSFDRSFTHPLQLPVYLRQAAEGLPAVEELQFVVPAHGGRGAGVGAGERKTQFEQMRADPCEGGRTQLFRNPNNP